MLDPNLGLGTNVSTHYYGVMGPGGAAATTTNSLNGKTYSYTATQPTTNGSASDHGMLTYFVTAAGSPATNRYIRFTDVADGLSNTLMVAERSVRNKTGETNAYRTWTRGNDGGSGSCKNVMYPINSQPFTVNNFNDISFGSNHVGGTNFARGDGSVKFLKNELDKAVYMAMASIDSGEVTPDE